MIDIQNLTKTYRGGVYALRGINLTIGNGMFGLLGRNGAGKTTLMRILAGLMNPTSGSVNVFGHDLSTSRGKQDAKGILGYLPQELGLYPNLTAVEFLDYIAILKGINDPIERRKQIDELIERVRLTDVAKRRIKTYSGGMKRRVGIAQALLGNPKLLIVDEPTVGLDPEERVRLRNLLSDTAQHCAVLLSTHIIEDISQSCHALAMMEKGEVVFKGSPRDLINGARGQVWNVIANGQRPEGVTVVSTLQLADGVQYRVIGEPPKHYDATPMEPTLEDGYMWAMQRVTA
jgi:ABC-2 type transport system ATP-binding protein